MSTNEEKVYNDDYKRCEQDVLAMLVALIGAGAKSSTLLLAIQCGDHRGKGEKSADLGDGLRFEPGFLVELASEKKRLIDVETMFKTRPPRVGDFCLVYTGITCIPGGAQMGRAEVIDLDPVRGLIRFAFGEDPKVICRTTDLKLTDYGREWTYVD